MEQTANGWLVILGIISVWLIGYAVGKWNGRYSSEEKLSLSIEEAIAILDGFAREIIKANHGIFSHYRDDLTEKTGKLADRLINKKLNSAYRLYAKRDELIEQIRIKLKA